MEGFYKNNEIYSVSVIDMLSPEVPMFTCGLNGKVREYPTKKTIQLSGAQINMLMNCNIPETHVTDDNGYSRVIGYSYYPRFAIKVMGLGDMPTGKATILNPYSSIPSQPKMFAMPSSVPDDTPNDGIALETPAVAMEREDVLGMSTRNELVEIAAEMGIQVAPRASKDTVIQAIIRAEEEGK